jgi:predicted secreted protein
VIHVLGLEFDEEHNGEVRFQISLQAFTGSML